MSFTKGGRGKQAPYESTHVRVPVPMKAHIQSMIEDYKSGIAEGEIDPQQPYTGVTQTSVETHADQDSIVDAVKQILKQKKNAKISLLKLVNKLYDIDLTEDDLK